MNPSHLFHVSEEANIEVFHPRPPPSPDSGVAEDSVWAIDYAHLPNYMTPRDCPRVTFGRGPSTTHADAETYLEGVAGRVVVIELGWLDRVRRTPLHIYAFERTPVWRGVDNGAGYFIATEPVTPVDRMTIESPASTLLALGSELRTRVNLWSLIDQVASSSLEFSIIRKRNAMPRPRI
jgi:hypothetical protein